MRTTLLKRIIYVWPFTNKTDSHEGLDLYSLDEVAIKVSTPTKMAFPNISKITGKVPKMPGKLFPTFLAAFLLNPQKAVSVKTHFSLPMNRVFKKG